MAGDRVTISVAELAQQLKQSFPQQESVPDHKLVLAFVSQNPHYSVNYQGTTPVSVSFDPVLETTFAQQSFVVRPAESSTSDVQANSAASDSQYFGNTVVVKAEMLSGPPMVGRYEIIDELGRGGMGIVYKAFDPGIGRTVALKLMTEQLARDVEFRERFLREARGAGVLQHPNIVTVHELGEWQGAPFIAMEFLQGHSLEEILTTEKSGPLEKRLDIVAQVCRGLGYAHARGIVHRDIKPANVMVISGGVAKVVDFGIARLADQKLTSTGNVLGTVSYMSPEQLQGRTVDGRSDIFAVGVMLYEALTAVLPFAAADTGAAITNILYRQPPKLSNYLANYPPQLDEIINKALAKDPDERFQTAEELAERLAQVRQEMQRSQTAPTIIRNIPLPSDISNPLLPPGSANRNPNAAASEHIQKAATKSAEFAHQWWKLASSQARRNAVMIACAAVLYLIAIPLVAVPVAILITIILAVQPMLVRMWWKSASLTARMAVAVLVTAASAFCFTKLATGMMWYVGFRDNRLMAIPVFAVVAIVVAANGGLAADWWKSASGKARILGLSASLFLIVCFTVSAMNWSSTPKSYFARGGEFEQKERSNQEILKAQRDAYDSTPLQVWTDTSLMAGVPFYGHKLMWTNKDNGKHVSWTDATNYCSTLRLSGYSDWRLPSVGELKGLSEGKRGFDQSVAIYHVRKGIFLSDPSIWSSAEGTGFDFGTEDDIGGRALCVRHDNGQPASPVPQAKPTRPAGQTIPAPAAASSNSQSADTTPTLTGVLRESDTGLMWETDSGKSDRTWSQAEGYCHDLRLSGFSDWRLATLNELESVYPHKRDLDLSSYVVWSSEPTAGSREAWYFYFWDGTKKRYTLPVNDTHHGAHALCVRGTFNGNFHNSETDAAEKQRTDRATAQQQKEGYTSGLQGVWTDPSAKSLMWMSKDNGHDIKWIDADSLCRLSRQSGYSDWHLPTVRELKSIYDGQQNLNNTDGAYHVKNGIRLSAPFVWSSQEDTPLNFLYGVPASTGGTSYNARALCVRQIG